MAYCMMWYRKEKLVNIYSYVQLVSLDVILSFSDSAAAESDDDDISDIGKSGS